MGSEDRRISGWKSIGAYFGRDRTGYVRELSIRESLRSDPSLRALLDALREAVGRGDLAAAGKLILARALADQQASAFPDHAFAAFVASSIGDRPALIRILALADSRNEKWGSAGYARQIARRWPDDAAVLRLLGARKRPRMEQQT